MAKVSIDSIARAYGWNTTETAGADGKTTPVDPRVTILRAADAQAHGGKAGDGMIDVRDLDRYLADPKDGQFISSTAVDGVVGLLPAERTGAPVAAKPTKPAKQTGIAGTTQPAPASEPTPAALCAPVTDLLSNKKLPKWQKNLIVAADNQSFTDAASMLVPPDLAACAKVRNHISQEELREMVRQHPGEFHIVTDQFLAELRHDLAAKTGDADVGRIKLKKGSPLAEDVRVKRNFYDLFYNVTRHVPDLTRYHVSAADFKTQELGVGRSNFYKDSEKIEVSAPVPGDPNVLTTVFSALQKWYGGTGDDLGHQMPAASAASRQAARETFSIFNMAPQRAALNRQTWRFLEDMIREVVVGHNGTAEVFVGNLYLKEVVGKDGRKRLVRMTAAEIPLVQKLPPPPSPPGPTPGTGESPGGAIAPQGTQTTSTTAAGPTPLATPPAGLSGALASTTKATRKASVPDGPPPLAQPTHCYMLIYFDLPGHGQTVLPLIIRNGTDLPTRFFDPKNPNPQNIAQLVKDSRVSLQALEDLAGVEFLNDLGKKKRALVTDGTAVPPPLDATEHDTEAKLNYEAADQQSYADSLAEKAAAAAAAAAAQTQCLHDGL